jgi:hypothetical protein
MTTITLGASLQGDLVHVVVFGRKTCGRVIAKGFILGSDLDSQTSGLNYTNHVFQYSSGVIPLL